MSFCCVITGAGHSGLLSAKGSLPMNDHSNNLNQIEQEILTNEVSDEALERAGTSDNAGNFTFGACTGLNCDGGGVG